MGIVSNARTEHVEVATACRKIAIRVLGIVNCDEIRMCLVSGRMATITEWPTKWFLKLSAADRPLRCMVLFWLFFVLVLVLSEAVLVLDRSCDCSIPSWTTRCSGGNLVMDWLMEISSMIRESGNGSLWAVTQVALMPCTRSVRLRARAPSATAD